MFWTQYSKTPLNAAPFNTISILRGSTGIPLNRTLYWYLLYMCVNENAIHQPKLTIIFQWKQDSNSYIFYESLS